MKYAPLILLLLVQITSAKESWENDGPIDRFQPPRSMALLKVRTGRIDVYLATERADKPATPPMVAYSKAIERSGNPRDWPLGLNIKNGWSISYGNGDFTAYKWKPSMMNPALFLTHWRGRVDSIEALWERLTKEYMHASSQKDSIVLAKNGFKSMWIDGAEFKGKAAIFDRTDGWVSTQFLLSNGNAIWVGHYSGPEPDWEEALEILLSLKQNG